MTIEELFDEFLLAKRAEGITAATVKWYSYQIRAFDAWLTGDELGPAALKRYMVHLRSHDSARGRPMAEASIASAHRALKSFFKWCEEEGLLVASPMAGVKLKKLTAKEPRRATRREVETLINTIPVNSWLGLRDYLIVHVLFFCGLRVGELVRLEAHHFDLDNYVLTVPGGKTGAGTVPLTDDVLQAFVAYMTHRPTGYTERLLVAANGHGHPRRALTEAGVRQTIEKRCKEAGIRHLSPHSFRHGIAMHLMNDKRVDLALIQRILRHSSPQITNKSYAQWMTAALVDEFRNVMGC